MTAYENNDTRNRKTMKNKLYFRHNKYTHKTEGGQREINNQHKILVMNTQKFGPGHHVTFRLSLLFILFLKHFELFIVLKLIPIINM